MFLSFGCTFPGEEWFHGNTLEIWDAATGKLVKQYVDTGTGAQAWSPDGKYIVSGEGNTVGQMVAKVWTA